MTHKEIIQHLIDIYKERCAQRPTTSLTNLSYREGMMLTWELTLKRESKNMAKYLRNSRLSAIKTRSSSSNPNVKSYCDGTIFACELALKRFERMDAYDT